MTRGKENKWKNDIKYICSNGFLRFVSIDCSLFLPRSRSLLFNAVRCDAKFYSFFIYFAIVLLFSKFAYLPLY